MNETQLSAKVITLYPEVFPGPLSASVTGRALEKKIWSLDIINLRHYGNGKHKQEPRGLGWNNNQDAPDCRATASPRR